MSAEKERRYQELYKNRFVNPIDQGVGRRTGWVLNKEVRKDSEGFELFEDYWSESGEESVDDFSLHVNKENNNGKPYKLSCSIPLMPDFTPSSRGSTEADPLTDGQTKTNPPATETTKVNTDTLAQKPHQQQADDGPQPAGTDKGTPKADATTPPTGVRDSDITGSIIRGGNSFQLPNSALQEFKTKTRLSFGGGDVVQKTKSTRRKSPQGSSTDDDGSASDSTLKASQSEGEPETHSSPNEDSSFNKQMALKSTGMKCQNASVVRKVINSAAEKISSNEDMMVQDLGSDPEDKERATTKNSETVQQKSSKRSTNRSLTASLKQPASNLKQILGDTAKPKGRKGRNIPLVEDNLQMSGGEGLFISLQKLTVTQRGVDKEMVPNGMNSTLLDQSSQNADNEDIDIVEEEDQMYSYSRATTSKRISKRTEKIAANKASHSESKMRTQKGKAKKGKTTKASKAKDEAVIIGSKEAMPPTPEATRETSKGASSEESGPINEKSHRQSSRTAKKKLEETDKISKQPSKDDKGTSSESRRQSLRTSRKSVRTLRSKSQRGTKSSSSERESGTATLSDAEIEKDGEKSRRNATKKKVEQNSEVAVGGEDPGSTDTDEDQDQRRTSRRKKTAQTMEAIAEQQNDGEGVQEPSQEKNKSGEDAKAPRARTRSGRGAKKANSPIKELDLGMHSGEAVDTKGNDQQPLNDIQNEVFSKKPVVQPSIKPRNKRASVHFSTVEVIFSEMENEDNLEPGNTQTPQCIKSPKPQVPLSDAEDGDDESGSPRKKFKRTPGVQLIRGRSTTRKSAAKTEESKSTRESVENSNRTQQSSSVRDIGKQRGGKRKLYSGDLPGSFLNDPSLSEATAAPGSSNMNPAYQGSVDNPASVDQVWEQSATEAKSKLPVRGPGQGRGRDKNRRQSNVTSKRTSIASEPSQENKEPDNIVLDFLTKYESGKESETTESESEEPPSSCLTETSENGGTSSSKDTPASLFTTVYPEPTPRSILKDSTTTGIGARKKNLTLQYFEVPRKKAIIIEPDEAENGRRRTKRNRVRPVEFWRNERPEYQRRKSGGFVLVGIQSPGISSPEVTEQRRSKRTGRKRAIPQTPANISMHVSPPPGSKLAEHPTTVVVNPDTQVEVEVDTLRTAKMNTFVGPSGREAMPTDPITLCKSITQKAFSSGILTIRPLCEKGMQFVQNDTMVFYVCRGKVSVTIHHTTSILQNGDMFFVPQGNLYNIKNLRRDEAKLVFFQHKGH